MATWSGIRNKLEQDYLAKSLQGRVTYFATSYTNAHDQIGRAAIRIDGKEIFKGDYYHKEWLHWECYQKLEREENEDRIDNWIKAWESEPEYLKFFLHLRMEAEGVRML